MLHIPWKGTWDPPDHFENHQIRHSALVVKTPPVNGGDLRDVGSIPGSGRSLEKEMATHSSIPAWRNTWTGYPGGLESIGWQRVGRY